MIPYARQSISEDDIDAVAKVLRSDFITQGPLVNQFEKAIANYCSAQYSIAVSNGTAALHLACLALDVSAGDIVWTSPNTFVASANCALYCGAKIDFVDIDHRTYNLSLDGLKVKLQNAELQGNLPKLLIIVHFAGQSTEMKEVKALSEQYGFAIIEDAAHALGGEYLGQKIGSCLYSDITIFSFHPAKMITTGEGGMVLTNKPELADKIKRLSTHGITKDPKLMADDSQGEWYYQQLELGFNYRITDIQAALGLSQLPRLDEFVKKRRQLAQFYNKQLEGLELTIPWQHPDSNSSWHLYVVRLNLEKTNKDRKIVYDSMRKADIGVHVHYIPVHTQPYYQQLGFKEGDFPESEKYYQEALTLPLYVDLTEQQISYITKNLSEIL